eukprot:3021484-Rhodomonas_salina.1
MTYSLTYTQNIESGRTSNPLKQTYKRIITTAIRSTRKGVYLTAWARALCTPAPSSPAHVPHPISVPHTAYRHPISVPESTLSQYPSGSTSAVLREVCQSTGHRLASA